MIAGAADAPKTSFYLLESTLQTADGRNLPASVSLVKRTTDPARGRIDESVISIRAGAPAQEFLTVLKPDGRKAKISCENCDIEGEAELLGEAWAWTGVKFTTRIPKLHQQVEGEDRFTSDGMSAEKRILGADGRPTLVIKESGRVISQATYDLLRDRILTK